MKTYSFTRTGVGKLQPADVFGSVRLPTFEMHLSYFYSAYVNLIEI